jgi:predicted nucleotidyltransferase
MRQRVKLQRDRVAESDRITAVVLHRVGSQRVHQYVEPGAVQHQMRHDVRELFGSLVRGEAQPVSDIDALVEIDPAADFGLLGLVGVRNLIGDRLDHKVEVVKKASLKPPLRDGILAAVERVF